MDSFLIASYLHSYLGVILYRWPQVWNWETKDWIIGHHENNVYGKVYRSLSDTAGNLLAIAQHSIDVERDNQMYTHCLILLVT